MSEQISRWLVVSYYAQFERRTPSHHIDDKLPLFAQLGVEATLLSSAHAKKHPTLTHWRPLSVFPRGLLYELKFVLKCFNHEGKWLNSILLCLLMLTASPIIALGFLVEKLCASRDKRSSWQLSATLAGAWCLWRGDFDVIYSAGGPAVAHDVGLRLSRWFKLPLVVEFRDPLKFQYPPEVGFEHQRSVALEKALAVHAKALIYVTELAAESARERLGTDNIHGVLAGYREEHFAPSCIGDKIVFSHVGTIKGGGRSLVGFRQACERVFVRNPELKKCFSLQLAGSIDDEEKRGLEVSSLGPMTNFLGNISRDEARKLVERSHVLLLVQGNTAVSRETIPSKFFQYLAAQRHIIGFVNNNPELSAILQSAGHRSVELDDDPEPLVEHIEQLLKGNIPEALASPYSTERGLVEIVALALA